MIKKILSEDDSYTFFTTCKNYQLKKISKAVIDINELYGVKFVETGQYEFVIRTNISESFFNISTDEISYPVILILERETEVQDTKYLLFSAFFQPKDIVYVIELFLEKDVTIDCILHVVSQNKDYFSVEKLFNIVGLDLNEYL
jgi:hypothetical protein